MTGKKLLSFPQWQPKTGTRQFDASFSWGGGGSPSSQGKMTPKFNEIGNNFMCFDKRHVVINSFKVIPGEAGFRADCF